MQIEFFNRYTDQKETEQVYGEFWVRWLYQSKWGRLPGFILSLSWFSKAYGIMQNSKILGRIKVSRFIQDFSINMDEYETSHSSFNSFFIRRFKEGRRSFITDSSTMPAFCEARYFAYKTLTGQERVPVKGEYLLPQALLRDDWSDFDKGPMLLARLCPVDYHRFHFPDEGELVKHCRIPGQLHSVNPLALSARPRILCSNERQVSILQSRHFGKLAYVEIGAICVGKIVQTHGEKKFFRGDEKGYFLFGGSTVMVFGEKGAWIPSQDLLDHTKDGLETFVKLGDRVASKR